jgi:hypothetical protein
MLKVMAFLVKKQGLDTGELIDYYERHHVPLILSLAPAPTTYRRNYLLGEAGSSGPDEEVSVDFPAVLVSPYPILLFNGIGRKLPADRSATIDAAVIGQYLVDHPRLPWVRITEVFHDWLAGRVNFVEFL